MRTIKSAKNFLAAIILAATPLIVNASETVWDFTVDGYNDPTYTSTDGTYYGNFGNTLSTSSGGSKNTEVTISAWSSTGDYDSYQGDHRIESARVGTNSYGLLTTNRNKGDTHYVDNKGADDFILLSFSKAIQLIGINFGLTLYDNDFSIAAFSTAPTFNNRTWSQVAGDAIFTSSFSQFSSGAHDISSATTPIESRYWLIGAFHSAFTPLLSNGGSLFGGENDGFKLAGITTGHSDPTEVNAPAGLSLFSLFVLLLLRNRRKA